MRQQIKQHDGNQNNGESVQTQLSEYDRQAGAQSPSEDTEQEVLEYFQILKLKGQPYLCSIPILNKSGQNETSEPISEADQQKELVRATDRGWELLQDLEDKCMYFVSGWWSYSFCYNSQIKQFHQLPPGNGAPIYPPQEDPTTPSYVLGRFNEARRSNTGGSPSGRKDITELKTHGETRYLVQQLGGGTTCDLTGKDRTVEVQFHCHPQSTDRIGYIKEVTTCTYLMVIYTPRLCNDVAFLPPREDRPNTISCREVLTPDEISKRGSKGKASGMKKSIDDGSAERTIVGNVEVGGKRLVGGEGRQIEKGRVVTPPEERADIVAKKERGEILKLSKDDMKKLEINPETIEQFSRELQEMAGDKDWKLEVIDDANGVRHIRGIVEGEDSQSDEASEDDENEGTEETYKEEL